MMPWKPSELKFMMENYQTMSQRNIAKALKRSHGTIQEWMDILDLKRTSRPPPPKAEPKEKLLQWNKGKDLQDIWR